MDHSALSAIELLRACVENGKDQAGWEEFARRFHQIIGAVALRTARRYRLLEVVSLDDLVQDVYLHFCESNCRILREFDAQSQEAVYGYLKVVTANLVCDRARALHAAKRGGGQPAGKAADSEQPAPGNGVGSKEHLDREILIDEIHELVRRHTSGPGQERDRLVFWLYFRQGLTSRAIAELPGVGLSSKGVESLLLRLTRQVRTDLATAARAAGPEEKVKGV